jgi:hypothetical protein
MTALAISLAAFAIMLAGSFGGSRLRRVLPRDHLSDDTRDLVRLGTALVGTMAALVLGLLIAAANASYGGQSDHVQRLAADLIVLDQVLDQYGPETRPTRADIRQTIEPLIARIWREDRADASLQSPYSVSRLGQETYGRIFQLTPQGEAQRALKERATQAMVDFATTRLLLFEQSGSTLPYPFLAVLVFWLAIIFVSYGLFADLNPIAVGALVVFALSAAAALFLVLELSNPFSGLMQISSDPLRNALAPL